MAGYVSPFANPAPAPQPQQGANTGYISPFKGSQYTADYWNQQKAQTNYNNQADKYTKLIDGLKAGQLNSSQQDANNIVQDTRKMGGIDVPTANQLLNAINQVNQGKIQQDFQKSLNPFQQGVKVVGDVSKGLIDRYYTKDMQPGGAFSAPVFTPFNIARSVGQFGADTAGFAGDAGSRLLETINDLNPMKSDAQKQAEAKTYQGFRGVLDNIKGPTGFNINDSKHIDDLATKISTGNFTGGDIAEAALYSVSAATFASPVTRPLGAARTTSMVDRAISTNIAANLPKYAELTAPKKILVSGQSDAHIIDVRNRRLDIPVDTEGGASRVNVRVGTKMPDTEYVKQFKTLSKAYDQANKLLENAPPVRQKIVQKQIDEVFQQRILDLDNAFSNTVFKDAKQPKLVQPKSQKTQTTPVVKPTSTSIKSVNGEASITDLSKKAVNSLENNKSGIKDGAVARAKGQIENGTAKPIQIRTLENGDVTIVDGRHRLQASKELGMTSYPVEDLTKQMSQSTAIKATGETKVAGSALKTESKAGTPLEGKATFTTDSYKQAAENAPKFVKDNPKDAKAIAMGDKTTGSQAQDVKIRQALEAKAIKEGDLPLIQELASSKSNTATSEAAQRLGAEGYGVDPRSPIDAIKSVNKVFEKQASKRQSIVKNIKKETKVMESSIKAPTKNQWTAFVESLKC